MSSLTILHFVVFRLVYGEHWGPLIEPKYCAPVIIHGDRPQFPCYLQDQMGFSFLYQCDRLYPSFYQINVLEDPFEDEDIFFYQKVRDAEIEPNIDKRTSKGADLRLSMEEGRIWRKINRRDLTYKLVTPEYSSYSKALKQNLWNEQKVIPARAMKYISGWKTVCKPLDPQTYLEHDFRKVLSGQMADYSTSEENVINWIQASVSQVINVDYMAPRFAASLRTIPILWNEILPIPNVQHLVEQQRAFSRSLLTTNPTKTRQIKMAVAKVLNKIWSYINAIEGITIGDIRGVVVPHVGSMPMPLADRKKNVVFHFNTYKVKRERGHINLVIPGQVSGDYDTFAAVVHEGNIREKLTMINGYGYIPNTGPSGCLKYTEDVDAFKTHCESCQAFWDVIFAYDERNEIDEAVMGSMHAKHLWDPFYLQWFNKDDISRRLQVLKVIEPNVFRDREMLVRSGKDIYNSCLNVRWQKQGDAAQMLQLQQHIFAHWGKAKMNNKKGTIQQQSRLVKIKDIYPPLSEREKTFIRQAAAETKNFYGEKVYTNNVFNEASLDDPTSTMFLPWWTGFSKFQPNYRMPYFYNALKLSRLSVASPSKSTDLMMDIAVSFGLTTKELFAYELGIISWMGMGPSHSIVEVLLGFPFDAVKIHDEKYTLNKDPYLFIEEQSRPYIIASVSANVDEYNYDSTNNMDGTYGYDLTNNVDRAYGYDTIDMLHSKNKIGVKGDSTGYDDKGHNLGMLVVSFVLIICLLCCTCAIIMVIVGLITYIGAIVMKGKQRMRDIQQFDDMSV